jgi:hypothetical protein
MDWNISMVRNLFAVATFVLSLSSLPLGAQTKDAQRTFDSPESAAKVLIAAAKANDQNVLVEIFGAKHRRFIVSADDPGNKESRARFAQAAEEYLLLEREGESKVTLVVGFDAWLFPIPLVREKNGWRFDTDTGVEEVLNRRIGANELVVIEVMRRYGGLQQQYASKPRDGTNVRQFARKIQSSPGKRDGLYWHADPQKGEELSPIGPLVPDASTRKGDAPYHGYYFKILTGQGAAAPGGRYSYVINGRMVAGFALLAFPADYGSTGIKTLIVNHYGIVYEKDLGKNSATTARAMTEYNPDSTWSEVEE